MFSNAAETDAISANKLGLPLGAIDRSGMQRHGRSVERELGIAIEGERRIAATESKLIHRCDAFSVKMAVIDEEPVGQVSLPSNGVLRARP